jgi:hypothetical protein
MHWHLYVFPEEANKCFGIYMFFSRKLTNALLFICFYTEANKCFGILEWWSGGDLQTLLLKTLWIGFFP